MVTLSRHTADLDKDTTVLTTGQVLTLKAAGPRLLCCGEGQVDEHEGGNVGDVPTQEGLYHGPCHLFQCSFLEGLLSTVSVRFIVNSASLLVGQGGTST